jgi:hypothetical protein
MSDADKLLGDLINEFLNLKLGATPDEALKKLRKSLNKWSDLKSVEWILENDLLKKKLDFILEQCSDLKEVIRLEKKEQRRLLKILKEK